MSRKLPVEILLERIVAMFPVTDENWREVRDLMRACEAQLGALIAVAARDLGRAVPPAPQERHPSLF